MANIRAGQAFMEMAKTDPEAQQAIKRLKAFGRALVEVVAQSNVGERAALDRASQWIKDKVDGDPDLSAYFAAIDTTKITGQTLPELSKLCKVDGPVRFRRIKNRLYVNMLDLLDFLLHRDENSRGEVSTEK